MEELEQNKKFETILEAAKSNHPEAQTQLGLFYRQNGKIYESMEWLIKAAHNSSSQAQGIITYVSNASLCEEKNEAFHTLDPKLQEEKVNELVKTKITPMLARDGGGVDLVNFIAGSNPQIWLNYIGACSGCHLGATSTADMLLREFENLIDKSVVLYLM